MKYRANFSVNNGTSLAKSLEGNNIRKLTKDVIDYAKGEIFRDYGNNGKFWVIDECGREVVCGNIYISKNLRPYARIQKGY